MVPRIITQNGGNGSLGTGNRGHEGIEIAGHCKNFDVSKAYVCKSREHREMSLDRQTRTISQRSYDVLLGSLDVALQVMGCRWLGVR